MCNFCANIDFCSGLMSSFVMVIRSKPTTGTHAPGLSIVSVVYNANSSITVEKCKQRNMRLYTYKRVRKFACPLCVGIMLLWCLLPLQRDSLKVKHEHSEEVRHIVFIKVHKAASSSIQNIFLRYGYNRNLTFVLGNRTNIYPQVISYSETITNENIEPPPINRTFDILCSHVIYNRRVFESIMPQDTVYFGIVREPFAQFVSTLHYFRPSYIFDIIDPDPISVYTKNPYAYEPEVKFSATNNRQSFEFGFPSNLIKARDTSQFTEYLNILAGEFKLILVAEYLAESVILMRRYLRWKTKHVIFILKNAWAQLDDGNKAALNERFFVNETTRDFYRKWAVLDYALYDFCVERLQHQVELEGPEFHEEVRNFKALLVRVDRFCTNVSRPYRFVRMTVEETRWNEEFVYTTTDCSQLLLSEKEFHDEIRLRQYGMSV